MTTQTTYQSVTIEVKGNKWSVLRASGKRNYVSIRKETNNPYKTMGKQFATEDEALAHYKSPAMQAALIQAFATI